jgi:nucleotide-binding universal stress UspA family protein
MKILVPVDFHKTSFSAYNYALNLANEFGGEITLLHVINGAFNTNDDVTFDPIHSQQEGAIKRLEYFADEYAKEVGIETPKLPSKKEVRFGIPGFTIADFANQNAIDIVIMGTRDKHGIFDRLLGSASSVSIRLCKKPVLLIHKRNRYNTPKKIAFAFDAKSDLEEAIEDIKTLNSKLRAKLEFVHVKNAEGNEDLNDQMHEIVSELFEDGDPNFAFEIKSISNGNMRENLKDYCLFEKVDVLTMMHRNESKLMNLFRTNQSVRMAQEFHLPVLVLHEDHD